MENELDQFVAAHPDFLQKGGLCVGLHATMTAKEKGLPLALDSLRTEGRGQVEGLGKARIQKILAAFGITKVLSEEGGRTNRGSLGQMEIYVGHLNDLHKKGVADVDTAMKWWVRKVQQHFSQSGPKFSFDASKSVRANLNDLFKQAADIQRNSGGLNHVGAMLQHLVGAKLDLILGDKKIEHHGASVADRSTVRNGDFQVDNVAIHVTTHPGEALIRKTLGNLKDGLRPLIVTLGEGVAGALYLLKDTEGADRVDVLDAAQFLTANIYERSLFQAGECKVTLRAILERYNEIVARCETDPTLRIVLG